MALSEELGGLGLPYPLFMTFLETLGKASPSIGVRYAISNTVCEGLRFNYHPDHVGGVQKLREALGVPVAAHTETAKRLSSVGIEVDLDLHDGQRVVLEGSPPFPILVSHTPGHARGHLTFYDQDGGCLLGGDLTAGFGTIVVDPPEGDMDDYLASLERMRDLGAKALFPAHGPPTIMVRQKFTEYLEHRLWRERKILEAWNQGLRDHGELLPAVYDDVPEKAYPLAARQLEAHLIRLERAGSIERLGSAHETI